MSIDQVYPLVYFEDDIVIVDFGNLIVTSDNLKHSIKKRAELTAYTKAKVIVLAEGTMDVNGLAMESKGSEVMASLTHAVAVVPYSKAGWPLAEQFIALVDSAYPIKVFENKDDAKVWLSNIET